MLACITFSLCRLAALTLSVSRALSVHSMCVYLYICARSYNMYSHWYYKRVLYFFLFFFLIPVLPHIFGAVNKHIRSIRTRVRDFMVRFYRLKLMFPLNTMMRCVRVCLCVCERARVCLYLSVLFFPFGELFYMWIALLLALARALSHCFTLLVLGSAYHYRMKIESIFLIYCSCQKLE